MYFIKAIPLLGLIGSLKAQEDPYRLPPNYKVNHYNINLTVPAKSFTADSDDYDGSVQIEFQVTVNTPEVKLHSNYDNIEVVTIQLDDKVVTKTKYAVNRTTDILTLQVDRLRTGVNYTLTIDFKAKLLESNGLYKVAYIDHNNETQYMVATHFQDISARKVFPCFDEPTYKATFAYSLTYPSDMTALSNTPALQNTTDNVTDGLITTYFATSPRMSTYLVAFTISKYSCTEGDLEGSTKFKYRICSRIGQENAREWPMYIAPRVIDNLNSYTGINYTYSISKLDVVEVGVPNYGGAMENWGLVLYRDTSLLFDKAVQTNANKQYIATLLSHELSHQWFGNLVTCKWWSELFLNEGLASMFEFYNIDHIFPDFQMEMQFVVEVVQAVMVEDGNLGMPALRTNVSTPTEISSSFGLYSYSKAGSVLRMIEHTMGRNNFKAGLQKYLRDNQYQPVEPQNLLDALESVMENEISNLNGTATLSQVMENWILKSGYPLLTATLTGTTIKISQKRFLVNQEDTEKTTWYVPVTYTTSTNNDYNVNTSPKGWVTPTEDYIITDFSGSNAWIIINNQHSGYYRVNYDTTLWNKLSDALKQSNFSGIHVANRAQVVEDSYYLARAGLLSFSQAFKNMEFLANDVSYFSWHRAVKAFSYILTRTGTSSKLGAAIRDHFKELSQAVAASVPLSKVDDEKQIYTLNQVLINEFVCKIGNSGCISDSKELFSIYRSSYTRPDINIRSIVYCNALRYSDSPIEDWNFLWEQYKNSSVSIDKDTIWPALGCATDSTVLKSFMSKVLTDDDAIKSFQYNELFSHIYTANEAGVDTALEFFIDNFEAINSRYNSLEMNVAGILTGIGSVSTKSSQLEKLQQFQSIIEDEILLSYVTAAVDLAKNNQKLIEEFKSDLHNYFGLDDGESGTDNTATWERSSLVSLVLVGLLSML